MYASNVEEYLFHLKNEQWKIYYTNLTSLPLDPSSMFVRSFTIADAGVGKGGAGLHAEMLLQPLPQLVRAFKSGELKSIADFIRLSNCAEPGEVKYGCRTNP